MLVPHRQGLESPIAHFIFTYTMCRSPLPNGESQWSNTARLCVLFFLLLVVSVATSESVSIITLDITDGGTASTYLFHQTSSSTSALLTTDGLKELLSNPFTATTLTVTTAGAQQQMESTMAATPIGFFTGGIPNTLANVNGMLLVDPINLISGLHQSNNNFIYLFAVLEQQLYMAAYYCKNEHIKAADIRVLIRSSSNSGAISAAAKAAFAYYGIALPSSSLVASSATITDELLTTGFTFVVGLATSDVAPLVSFLDTQTAATVMVDFDDLTLLYDTFVTSFGTVVKPSMSRLLYATNLPRWNNVGVSRSIVDVMRGSPMTPLYARTSTDTLAAFYSFMPTAYHTPGGLRAYITALVVDAAAGSDIASTAALSDAMYGGTGVTVDGAKYGVFRNQCAAPSLDQSACKSNVGVKEQSLWSFASTLTGASPLFGPTASGYAPGADWEVGDNGSSVSVWLWGMLIVIGVMLLLLVLLAVMCLCASCGRRSSQSDSRQNRSRAEPSQVESANWKTSERGVPSAFYESEPFASCSNELGDSSLCVSVVLLEGGSLILCAPRELQEVLKEWGQLIHSLAQEHGLHVHSESSWELTFCCPSDVTITNFAETLHEQLCHVTFASIRPLRTAVLALHEPLSMNGTCGDNQEEPLFFFPLRTRISIARSLAPGAPTEHVWISRLHS